MPRHDFGLLDGRIEFVRWDSDALAGNLLKDPTDRAVAVHLPAGYDDSDADYPLFVELAPFTGSGFKRIGWQAFGESMPRRVERLVGESRMGPVVTAYPDSFTSVGGNQFVDSAATGRWEAWLLDEMIPRLEGAYRVRAGGAHRAVYGKSSGGYGALIQGMKHGGEWGGVACHSGDIGFDLVYRSSFADTLDVLARHGGDVTAFLESLRAADKIRGSEFHALMMLGMAASYDPDPESPHGIRLPVDARTCELDEDRWRAWLRHDPLTLVQQDACLDNLRRLRLLFFDCGTRDPYHLHYGARALARRLRDHGVPHVHEEFDDDHSGLDYRLDRSLPMLFEAIAG